MSSAIPIRAPTDTQKTIQLPESGQSDRFEPESPVLPAHGNGVFGPRASGAECGRRRLWDGEHYPDTPENRAFVADFKKAYNRNPRIGALYGYMTARFIAAGYKKAGKLDRERLVDALEGMTLNSPVGRLEVRNCDHQLLMPMYFGVTKKDPKYNFLTAGNIEVIEGKDYIPSCQEVLRLRKK